MSGYERVTEHEPAALLPQCRVCGCRTRHRQDADDTWVCTHCDEPPPALKLADAFRATLTWPGPTPEMLADPLFEAIWQAIKTWDINVPGAYSGYMGATGNHARALFEAIIGSAPPNPERRIDMQRQADHIEVARAAAVLMRYCHGLSRQCGWWDRPDANHPMMTPVRLMLAVSELGEAMEGHRKGRMDDHLPHRRMVECEIGDAVIRLFDQAGGEGYDLPGAIAEKLAYNQQRADHRPENRAKPGGKTY